MSLFKFRAVSAEIRGLVMKLILEISINQENK